MTRHRHCKRGRLPRKFLKTGWKHVFPAGSGGFTISSYQILLTRIFHKEWQDVENYYNYFTEIEEHFVRRRGKHLLVSPMDWHLIASWRNVGVPLNVALRGIDIAMDGYYARRTRGMSKVNSLCYCHDAVMDAYAGYLESRVGEAASESGDAAGAGVAADSREEEFGKDVILDFLSERISEIESLLTKQTECRSPENIERATARLREIVLDLQGDNRLDTEALERDLGILDALLCEEMWTWLGAEEREAWEREEKSDKILKVYKKQLPKDSYEKMRVNYFRDKTRKKFHFGELSLFRI